MLDCITISTIGAKVTINPQQLFNKTKEAIKNKQSMNNKGVYMYVSQCILQDKFI